MSSIQSPTSERPLPPLPSQAPARPPGSAGWLAAQSSGGGAQVRPAGGRAQGRRHRREPGVVLAEEEPVGLVDRHEAACGR